MHQFNSFNPVLVDINDLEYSFCADIDSGLGKILILSCKSHDESVENQLQVRCIDLNCEHYNQYSLDTYFSNLDVLFICEER